MNIELLEDHFLISVPGKRVSIPVAVQPDGADGPDIVVYLDDIEHWQEPEGAEISLEDLARLTEWIESYCDKQGIEVEFE